MSQNKTIIQGLEPNPNIGNKQHNGPIGFYARSGNAANGRGTIVPGMMSGSQPIVDESTYVPNQQPKAHSTAMGKPVVGFLYSVSRMASGEFWPISIGRNVIGKNADADIFLAEATVSDNHATLMVRQIRNTGSVMAAISDAQSTNGTMVNGETVPLTGAMECHNGDIITIGNNYELVLVLIDVAKLGLTVSKDFMPIELADNEEEDDAPIFGGAGKTQPGTGFSPYGSTPWGSEVNDYAQSGTVGLDGQGTGGGHGGTIPM